MSGITYVVGDGTRTVIVRRPPLGHVLATAHDMGREHRVITALRDTPVPVPTTYAVCEDPDAIGAPFYAMERGAGTPSRSRPNRRSTARRRSRSSRGPSVVSGHFIRHDRTLHPMRPRVTRTTMHLK